MSPFTLMDQSDYIYQQSWTLLVVVVVLVGTLAAPVGASVAAPSPEPSGSGGTATLSSPAGTSVSEATGGVASEDVGTSPSSAVLVAGDGQNTSEDNSLRLYQGRPVTLEAQDDDTPFLVQNVDTNQTALEGATGYRSQTAVLDTDDLEIGTYRVVFNPENNPDQNTSNKGPRQVKYITVKDLELQATLEEDGHLFDDDETFEIDVNGSAARGNSSLVIEVGGFDTFAGAYTTRLNDRGEFDFSANISEVDTRPGEYTVTVIDVRTGVSVDAGSFLVDDVANAASFSGGVFGEQRGDVVEIPVEFRNGAEGAQAHVSVGSLGDNNYVTNVTVADQDGDGEVVLEFNTFMAGTGNASAVFTARGADTVTSWRGERGQFVTGLEQAAADAGLGDGLARAKAATLDAASYELQVAAATDGDSGGAINFSDDGLEAQDVGVIDLGSRSADRSTVWRLPGDKTDDLSLEFVDEATDNTDDEVDGNLTQTDRVTNGEIVVHQVTVSGIEGVLRNRTDPALDGSNDTFAFLQELEPGVAGREYAGTANVFDTGFALANPGPNEDDREFAMRTAEDVTFLPDYRNDTYYIAVDTDDVVQDKLRDGDLWNATFDFTAYDAIGPVLGGTAGALESEWTYEDPVATLDTVEDRVEIRNLEAQRIAGQTNVAPGTRLEVRIQSQNPNNPFLLTLDTRVERGGGTAYPNTLTFTGDFSRRSAGTNFTAAVRRSASMISREYDGRLLGPPTASVTFGDQVVSSAVDTQVVTVGSVSTSDGGFVTVHEGGAAGPVVGVSAYLEPGTHENVRIALKTPLEEDTTLTAMAHLDTDGDNVYEFAGGSLDGPYTDQGVPIADDGDVTVDGGAATGGDGPTVTVDSPSEAVTGVRSTFNVTGSEVVEVRIGGDTDDWIVNETTPDSITTVPDETPYVSVENDTWGHVFALEDDHNSFNLTVTPPETAGNYTFTATVTNATGATASEQFTVSVTNRTEHPSGVTQRQYTAVAGADDLDRREILGLVRRFIQEQSVDGVSFTREDVVTLVSYYVRQ